MNEINTLSTLEATSFDYSLLDNETQKFLQQRAENMHRIADNTRYQMGKELFEAQTKLAKNYKGTFIKWFESLGLDKDNVYFWINEFKFSRNLENTQEAINFGKAPKTLKKDVMKKSSSQQAKDAVLNGEVTSHKEFLAYEKRIKQQEQDIADRDKTIANQQAELEDNRKTQLQLNNQLHEALSNQPKQETKVVTKTVTKEVKPDDYDEIKSRLASLEQQSRKDKEDIEYYKKELDASERIRKQEQSDDHLKELELKRKKRDAQIDGYTTSLNIADFVPTIQKITQDDINRMGDEARQNLRSRLDLLRNALDELDAKFDGPQVIEGEVN